MAYKFNALKGKIIENYGTLKAFAKAMGFSPDVLSCKLHNKSEWKCSEIIKASNLLKMSGAEVDRCFFAEIA